MAPLWAWQETVEKQCLREVSGAGWGVGGGGWGRECGTLVTSVWREFWNPRGKGERFDWLTDQRDYSWAEKVLGCRHLMIRVHSHRTSIVDTGAMPSSQDWGIASSWHQWRVLRVRGQWGSGFQLTALTFLTPQPTDALFAFPWPQTPVQEEGAWRSLRGAELSWYGIWIIRCFSFYFGGGKVLSFKTNFNKFLRLFLEERKTQKENGILLEK